MIIFIENISHRLKSVQYIIKESVKFLVVFIENISHR
jgi:hypothetical protein